MKQRLLLFVSTLVFSIVFANSASAYDVEVDGIYYNLIKKYAMVVSGNEKYIGDLEIPASISIDGVEYTVNSIGSGAFYNCRSLNSVKIPNSVTSIEKNAFYDCINLNSVSIPNSVITIENNAFYNCKKLTSVSIPNSVKTIFYNAFSGCGGLTSIIIPNSVKSIGTYAFENCKNLENVYCYAEEVPITHNYVFEGAYIEYATLYVPANSIEKYKSTKPWSDFGTIKAITEEETKQCATPVISYSNGELIFSCETEGAKCTYNIKSPDVTYDGTFSQNMKLPLYAYYNIYCEATAEGYTKSDLAEATLYWLPTEGTLETNINTAETRGVMATSSDGFVILSGLNANEIVIFYSADGKELGAVKAIDGTAQFAAQSGSVVVAKIGGESLKIAVK